MVLEIHATEVIEQACPRCDNCGSETPTLFVQPLTGHCLCLSCCAEEGKQQRKEASGQTNED